MPKSCVVTVTDEAHQNIVDIGDYIALDSRTNADRFVQKLHDVIRSLDLFPQRYRVFEQSDDPDKTVRLMPVPPFQIYSRILEERGLVEVLAVRHGARDRPPRFFG